MVRLLEETCNLCALHLQDLYYGAGVQYYEHTYRYKDLSRQDSSEFVVVKKQVLEFTKVSQVGWYVATKIIITKVHHLKLVKISQAGWYFTIEIVVTESWSCSRYPKLCGMGPVNVPCDIKR